MILENRPHIKPLMEHRRIVLRGVTPVFLGEGGIEEVFCSLFAIKATKDRSSLLDNIRTSGTQCITTPPKFVEKNPPGRVIS